MSLSKILEKQKKRTNNLDAKIPEPETDTQLENLIFSQLADKILEAKLDTKIAIPQAEEDIPDPPQPLERNFMFIADCKMTRPIQQQLRSYSKIRAHDSNFTNRTTADLYKAGIKHIWINIGNRQARNWLELNLKMNAVYTTVLVWTGNKRNKFLVDLKPHVDIESKACELSKISALSLDEMMDKLGNKVSIHSPANLCASIFGCSKNLTAKKKRA